MFIQRGKKNMNKNVQAVKSLVCILGYSAVLVLGCIGAIAADANPERNTDLFFKGTPSWLLATITPLSAQAISTEDSANLYKIYSNLGPKGEVYWYSAGWDVSGPDYEYGEQWVGFPFIPKADAEVTEIEVAIANASGTNGVTISLNKDSSGLPGQALRTWNITNLPTFGSCCKLDVARSLKGIKVKKATQYWIVASTNNNTENTSDGWYYTYKLAQGSGATFNGRTWFPFKHYLGAFGVFGKRLD
jgi:hypothetical protein